MVQQGRCTAVIMARREKHRGLQQESGLGNVKTPSSSITKLSIQKMSTMKMGTDRLGMQTGAMEQFTSIITAIIMKEAV